MHRYFFGNWRLLRESSYIHVSTGIAISLQLHGDAVHWLRFQTKRGLSPILDTCRTVWNGLSFNYHHHYWLYRPWLDHGVLCFFEVLYQFFLRVGVVSLTPNLQPGGPEYLFLSGSSPLTCLVWEALPLAYTTASIALGVIWPHKPHHCAKAGYLQGALLIIDST